MELFIKLSSKTELQQCLDRDLKNESCGCGLEESPLESRPDDAPAPFGQRNRTSGFQVDLWEGWFRP